LVLTVFSIICSALFSFLASDISNRKQIKRYASSAMRHLDVVRDSVIDICQMINSEIEKVAKTENDLNKDLIVGSMENMKAMITGLISHIGLGSTNWIGILDEKFEKPYIKLYEDFEQLKQKLEQLDSKKESDQKEIELLKQKQEVLNKQMDILKSLKPNSVSNEGIYLSATAPSLVSRSLFKVWANEKSNPFSFMLNANKVDKAKPEINKAEKLVQDSSVDPKKED